MSWMMIAGWVGCLLLFLGIVIAEWQNLWDKHVWGVPEPPILLTLLRIHFEGKGFWVLGAASSLLFALGSGFYRAFYPQIPTVVRIGLGAALLAIPIFLTLGFLSGTVIEDGLPPVLRLVGWLFRLQRRPHVVCSDCSAELEHLGDPADAFSPGTLVVGSPALLRMMEQWRGNVCVDCRRVFCPRCISVGAATSCPKCRRPTHPAQRSYLEQAGLL